ncbi:hypothetical protein RvY_01265-3 [Ramazzottius varieornatus]|uniref:Uncharacterized protein n=1 Tax=Ramazzottius varieornatus TaxID=947166 RepID=A0A1D1UQF8_RAMVA|nr:hypothetical protein RvY_01265-3 [Ramazzottius varieornatus]
MTSHIFATQTVVCVARPIECGRYVDGDGLLRRWTMKCMLCTDGMTCKFAAVLGLQPGSRGLLSRPETRKRKANISMSITGFVCYSLLTLLQRTQLARFSLSTCSIALRSIPDRTNRKSYEICNHDWWTDCGSIGYGSQQRHRVGNSAPVERKVFRNSVSDSSR